MRQTEDHIAKADDAAYHLRALLNTMEREIRSLYEDLDHAHAVYGPLANLALLCELAQNLTGVVHDALPGSGV